MLTIFRAVFLCVLSLFLQTAVALTPGALDTSFSANLVAGMSFDSYAHVYTAALQADGKTVVSGFLHDGQSGNTTTFIARVNADGSADTGFAGGSLGGGDFAHAIVPLANNKILIGGGFTSYNSTSRKGLARLNADGSLDTAFSMDASFSGAINAIQLQSDDKILLGGLIDNSGDGTTPAIAARLNSDGSKDSSFSLVAGTSCYTCSLQVKAMALQSDGKVVIGGDFQTVRSTTRKNIARLNNDGTLDTAFSVGAGADGSGAYVNALLLQPDGKILLAGEFTSYNGYIGTRIARATSAGTPDYGFNYNASGKGQGLDFQVHTMALQADGSMVLGGQFDAFGAVAAGRILRLAANGNRDTSFTINPAANYNVMSLAVQPNGKVLVGGWFRSYNGTASNALVRISSGDTDNDSLEDIVDPDDDNDGVVDASDAFPLNPSEWLDSDGDGIGNNADPDDDNDGIPDVFDPAPFDSNPQLPLNGSYKGGMIREVQSRL